MSSQNKQTNYCMNVFISSKTFIAAKFKIFENLELENYLEKLSEKFCQICF